MREDFIEQIKNLHTREAFLQSEKIRFGMENQKLQQNLQNTTELHEEKRRIYSVKFMAEDHCRLETEKKSSQA
jgi:Tfp pilus assembly protein PilN